MDSVSDLKNINFFTNKKLTTILDNDNLDKESQYIYPDAQLSEIIDISLRMDKNKDGYVDFGEYRNSEAGANS